MGCEEGSPFEIIPIAEGILLIPYNPIETFGNRVDALLSDVKGYLRFDVGSPQKV